MKRLRAISLFTSFAVIIAWRYLTIPSPLPPNWTPDSTVRFTARILEIPEHTDTKTIIRRGRWVIQLPGYVPLVTGRMYTFVGRVESELLLGKIRRIEMVDPTILAIDEKGSRRASLVEMSIVFLHNWRAKMVHILEQNLPEPHASLSAGILLGIKASMPYDFYQALVATGTLHVIAASGYNVTVVATALMFPLMRVVRRRSAILLGILGIGVYMIIAGMSPAIVRAGIMGGLTLLSYIWGRAASAKRLLWITAYIMLLIDPLLIAEVGFQLSFVATAGILYLEPRIKRRLQRTVLCNRNIQAFLADCLYPTLAASISTLPVILWHFGRISYISPIVNLLILPVVPIVMLLSALSLAVSWIPILDKIAFTLLYVPLAYIVQVILSFG